MIRKASDADAVPTLLGELLLRYGANSVELMASVFAHWYKLEDAAGKPARYQLVGDID